jgi:lipopolysaccharide export system permease protein
MKILTRYIITEFIPPTAIGLAVFTFILIVDRIFDLVRLIINRGINVFFVLKLLAYLLPSLLSLSIPMAILSGTLLCFGRLSNDNEVTAIRSSGISLNRIIFPVVAFSLIISLLLIPLNQTIAPDYLYKFRKLYFRMMYKNPLLKLEEHTFINISDYRIYVEKIKREKSKLSGVVIYQMKKNELPTLITAMDGSIESRNDVIVLHLENGNIRKREKDNLNKYNIIDFKKYDIILASAQDVPELSKRIKEMNYRELKKEILKLKESGVPDSSLLIELYQRYSFAFAGLVFCLIGAPLGIKTHAKGKSIGFGFSLIIIFSYYFLLAVGITLSDKKILPSVIGMWIPNITFGLLGLWLIYWVTKK